MDELNLLSGGGSVSAAKKFDDKSDSGDSSGHRQFDPKDYRSTFSAPGMFVTRGRRIC